MVAPPAGSAAGPALREHFRRVADGLSIPLVVQDLPSVERRAASGRVPRRPRGRPPARIRDQARGSPHAAEDRALRKAAPALGIFGGLGGTALLQELDAGSDGTMTGFALPSPRRDRRGLRGRRGRAGPAPLRSGAAAARLRGPAGGRAGSPQGDPAPARRRSPTATVRQVAPSLDARTLEALDSLLDPLLTGRGGRMRVLAKLAPGPGNVGLAERDERVPGPGEVAVSVRAAGVCGTDLHIEVDEFTSFPPVTMGHEVAGVVAAVGAGGRRVVGRRPCRLRDVLLDLRGVRVVPRRAPESLSRAALDRVGRRRRLRAQVIVPARNLHRIPDWLDEHAAPLAEPLACVCHCLCDPSAVVPGDEVLVTGAGPIGLLAAQVARAFGGEVLVTGLARDTARLAAARALGFDTAERGRPQGVHALRAAARRRRRRRVLGQRGRSDGLPRDRAPGWPLRPDRRLRTAGHGSARPRVREGARRHVRLRVDAALLAPCHIPDRATQRRARAARERRRPADGVGTRLRRSPGRAGAENRLRPPTRMTPCTQAIQPEGGFSA